MTALIGFDTLTERKLQIKARIENVQEIESRLYHLTESIGTLIEEIDTNFDCKNGRLKLRKHNHDTKGGRLIFYERQNISGPKVCEISEIEVVDTNALTAILSRAMGELGVVRKLRRTYTYLKSTRINLDEVDGLGFFIEADIPLDKDNSLANAEQVVNDLITHLGIKEENLEKGTYMDLILLQTKPSRGDSDSDYFENIESDH